MGRHFVVAAKPRIHILVLILLGRLPWLHLLRWLLLRLLHLLCLLWLLRLLCTLPLPFTDSSCNCTASRWLGLLLQGLAAAEPPAGRRVAAASARVPQGLRLHSP